MVQILTETSKEKLLSFTVPVKCPQHYTVGLPCGTLSEWAQWMRERSWDVGFSLGTCSEMERGLKSGATGDYRSSPYIWQYLPNSPTSFPVCTTSYNEALLTLTLCKRRMGDLQFLPGHNYYCLTTNNNEGK